MSADTPMPPRARRVIPGRPIGRSWLHSRVAVFSLPPVLLLNVTGILSQIQDSL